MTFLILALLASFSAGLGAWRVQAATPGIRWQADGDDPRRARVVVDLESAVAKSLKDVTWPPPRWQRLLEVRTDTEDVIGSLTLPPMSGSYRVEGGALVFEPAFPLQAGLGYRATFRPAELPAATTNGAPTRPAPWVATHRVPRPKDGPATRITQVYPTIDHLPENLLKFYLHFSAPMSRGSVYDHVELAELPSRRRVELPFLELAEELWDPAMRRLTLLLDPGRIKRGVKPLEDIGPALEAGKRYSLTIRRDWLDAAGNGLADDFTKAFTVTAPDREPPNPASWILHPPAAASRDPLRVDLDEPLDHAIASRVFRIFDANRAPVEGVVQLDASERRLSFSPARPWGAGPHRLTLPNTIEDLAGNNVGKPFDVDLFEKVDRQITNAVTSLPFVIR